MAKFPYIQNAASIERFFGHIQTAGEPPEVTIRYLESVGFKSSNDRNLIRILKFIGLLDPSGKPTGTWRSYKHRKDAPGVMASALRTAYGGLFTTYPDAYRKDDEPLRDYFSTKTGLAETTLAFIVRTFTALCKLADFEAPSTDMSGAPSMVPTPVAAETSPTTPRQPPDVTVNTNIQLGLPATEDASIYEKLFAALKKHLFS